MSYLVSGGDIKRIWPDISRIRWFLCGESEVGLTESSESRLARGDEEGAAGGGPNATWANLGVPLAYSGARYETGLPRSAAIRISA
jgi:hypothetical protein